MRFSATSWLKQCLDCKQNRSAYSQATVKIVGATHDLGHVAVVELMKGGLVTVFHYAFKFRNWASGALWKRIIRSKQMYIWPNDVDYPPHWFTGERQNLEVALRCL